MPRKPRLFVTGATYHVYCRVARGEFVFDEPEEVAEFVEICRRVRDLDGWRILAWCLMGNHYHLVVQTDAVPLWRSMLRLQANVARGFNRRHRYLGRLWQSRYRARIIDSQIYFRQVVSYVHLNPVAAGIVSEPSAFPHSGHREILGRCAPRLIDINSVLGGFGDPEQKDGQKSYLSWVRAVAEARWLAQGIEHLPWWQGAKDVDEIANPSRHPDARTFDGRMLDDDRPDLEPADFAGLFEECSENSLSDLASPLRSQEIVQGRIELATLAVGRYRLRSRDIAALIDKHPSSVARWLNLGLRQQRHDLGFLRHLDTIDQQISTAVRKKATMRTVAP